MGDGPGPICVGPKFVPMTLKLTAIAAAFVGMSCAVPRSVTAETVGGKKPMRAEERHAHAPLIVTFQSRKAPTPGGTRQRMTVFAVTTEQSVASSSVPVAPSVAVTVVEETSWPSRARRAAVLPNPVPSSHTSTYPAGATRMSFPASVALYAEPFTTTPDEAGVAGGSANCVIVTVLTWMSEIVTAMVDERTGPTADASEQRTVSA